MMTYILIAFTALISIPAFSKRDSFYKLQFNAYQIYHRKQWYRLLTHGFLHANWMHLIVNMLVLYFFGPKVEGFIRDILPVFLSKWHHLIYILYYFVAIVIASLTSLYKHREDPWYNAVGASGAVSAVLFTFIFFNPWELLYFYGIIPVPGIVMGVLYLIYSHYMGRRESDNVNHDAHLSGAIFGFIFPLLIDVKMLGGFIHRLLEFSI
ncbi:MAG TPA: rhomboid family intramembrane serine protease [Bacteroidales bacterium]|jgi:membrane associated rhomboid family serine protease|nr:rhomboid family intramembrane serine protease [Bacteroidales bacterium]